MQKKNYYIGGLVLLGLVVIFMMTSCDRECIAGPDENGDGVRDDVEVWIVDQGFNKKTEQKIIDFAKAQQKFILSDGDEEVAVEAARERGILMDCIWYIEGFEEGTSSIEEIRDVILNTPERVRAYLKADSLLGGHTFSSLTDEERAEICQ